MQKKLQTFITQISAWILIALITIGYSCHQPIPTSLNTCKLTQITFESSVSKSTSKWTYDYFGKKTSYNYEYNSNDGSYWSKTKGEFRYSADHYLTLEKYTYTYSSTTDVEDIRTINYYYDQEKVSKVDNYYNYRGIESFLYTDYLTYSGDVISTIRRSYSNGRNITSYFSNGTLTGIYDSNQEWSYIISNGNIVTEYKPQGGNTYTYEFDVNGQVIKEEHYLGGALQYSYRYTYDTAINPNATSLYERGHPQTREQSWELYQIGFGANKNNLISSIDANLSGLSDYLLSYTYNTRNLPIKCESNTGEVTTYTYSDCD